MAAVLGVTHHLHGLTAGLGVGTLAPSALSAVGCGMVGLVAAGVPDLDHPQGSIPRALGPFGAVVCVSARTLSVAVTGVAHRGLFHSLFMAGASGLTVGLIVLAWLGGPLLAAVLGLAALAGVLAALAGDVVTHAGLSLLLWPARVHVRLPKWAAIRVGKWFERMVIVPGSALVAAGAGVWMVTTWT